MYSPVLLQVLNKNKCTQTLQKRHFYLNTTLLFVYNYVYNNVVERREFTMFVTFVQVRNNLADFRKKDNVDEQDLYQAVIGTSV